MHLYCVYIFVSKLVNKVGVAWIICVVAGTKINQVIFQIPKDCQYPFNVDMFKKALRKFLLTFGKVKVRLQEREIQLTYELNQAINTRKK